MATGGQKRPDAVGYHDDKKDPQNIVIINLDIPGLKKAFLSKKPDNANIKLDLSERSFNLIVSVQSKGKTQDFAYSVKKLPDLVEVPESPSTACCKVPKDGELVISLQKKSPKSWAGILSRVGLDIEGME